MIRAAAAALAATCLLPAGARAQDGHLNLFLYEKSYAGLGTPSVIGAPDYYVDVAEPKLLSEAQFAGHIALHRGLNAQELQEGAGGSGWNWYITPQFRLRGLDVPSGPVRSPSFMPKFTIQWLRSTGGAREEPTSGPRTVHALQLVIGHHSNGGETCEFVDEDPENACALFSPPADPPEDRVAWVQGGNFSTNYVEVGYYLRRGALSDDPDSHWAWSVDAGLAFQHHQNVVGFPLPGGAKADFATLYGRNRVRVDLAANVVVAKGFAVRGWARTDLFRTGADRFAGARGYALESELFVQRVEGLRDASPLIAAIPTFVGAGIRYARGQDYYNTQYVRDIDHLQFFIVVDPWSPQAGN